MENGNNSKLTANYTKEKYWRLIEIIEGYTNIIENKKSDAFTWKDKKNAWQNICLTFTSGGTQNRTWEQLRSKYEVLKKETRRAVTKSRTEILGTGGGPCVSNIMNPLYEKIWLLIKLSCEGTPSCFDSDYIDIEANNAICIAPEFTSDEVQTCATTLIVRDTLDISDGEIVSNEAEAKASDKEVNSWSTYCPAQLKTPKHTALQAERPRKRLRQNVNISAAGQKKEPWLNAKTELTNLKLKLLDEEFKLKQQQERELHQQRLELNVQQIEINKLLITKLQLEIKNLQN